MPLFVIMTKQHPKLAAVEIISSVQVRWSIVIGPSVCGPSDALTNRAAENVIATAAFAITQVVMATVANEILDHNPDVKRETNQLDIIAGMLKSIVGHGLPAATIRPVAGSGALKTSP